MVKFLRPSWRWFTQITEQPSIERRCKLVSTWNGKAAEALSVLNHWYKCDTEYVAGVGFTLLAPRDQHEFLVAIG